MPYDLTFNWNIINRRNKETHIPRDIEEGSGEGIVGSGVCWSYYKGHKDKIKGEGRREGEVLLAGV